MVVVRLWGFELVAVVVVALVFGQEDVHRVTSFSFEYESTDPTTPCSEVEGNETCDGNVTYVSVDITTVEVGNVTEEEEVNITVGGSSTVEKELKGRSKGDEELLSCSCNLEVSST